MRKHLSSRVCHAITILVFAASVAGATQPAPLWELNDLTGQPHRLEDLRGRWLLLKLGTTECELCALESEELAKVREELAGLGVEVIDIYLREDRYTVKKYWKKKPEGAYRPLILYDPRGYLIRDYQVSIIPQMVVVDPAGLIAWKGLYTPGPALVEVLETRINRTPQADGS